MAIYFPQTPSDGQVYPQPGDTAGLRDTGGIIFQYDMSTKSWTIVGPDNVATTDWVKAQFKDDQTALDKGYDLITATNDLTVDTQYETVRSDTTADNIFEQSIRGEVITDGKPLYENLDYYLTEWEDSQNTAGIPGSAFAVAGIKQESLDNSDATTSAWSRKYKDVRGLIISDYNSSSEYQNFEENIGVGDTIELNFIGSSGNLEYVIYKVWRVRKVDTSTSWGIGVDFHASSHPDEEVAYTSSSTYYELKVFKKSFTSEGGQIDGKLSVVFDAEDTFVVRPTDKNKDDTFVVDTIKNQILANDEYDKDQDYEGVTPDNGLATYGYVNRRLGNDLADNVGPFLPTAGGTLTGAREITIKRYSGAVDNKTGGFFIKGKRGSDGGNGNLLTIKHNNARGDQLIYDGEDDSSEDFALLNRKQINKIVDEKTDEYLKKSGDQMTGGHLSLANEPTQNQHATTKLYVDSRPIIVPDAKSSSEIPTEPGSLYSRNGTLYWVKP